MEYAKKEVAFEHNWTAKYTNAVAREFERFMILKSIDDDISPSYHVDLLWHQLLLDTVFYYNYCSTKFGKLIQHYPQNSQDTPQHNAKRAIRYARTIQLYTTTFKSTPPPAIWTDD